MTLDRTDPASWFPFPSPRWAAELEGDAWHEPERVLPEDWTTAPHAVETHISVVLLVGDRALKLLKPIRTGFLDHRSVDARVAALSAELRVNRRFAPDVYLGIGWLGGGRTDAEPVLVMRRMPEERRLTSLLGAEEAETRIREVARLVARLHDAAPRRPDVRAQASPSALRSLWADNLAELRAVSAGIVPLEEVAELEVLASEYLAGRAPLLRARRLADRIVDGHGDLRADDIFCLEDGPRILDCLAFSDRFRFGDVLLDVAFLAMDLERLGVPDLAAVLRREYSEATGDPIPHTLWHHYVAYRASVRAKVACYQAVQDPAEATARARALSHLARAHLRAGRVLLVLVGGAPGSGKSTLARALGASLEAAVISSDEVRKRRADLPAAPLAQPLAYGEGIYSTAHTEGVYWQQAADARAQLARGRSVVLDATFGRAEFREHAWAAARDVSALLVEIECDAPADVLAERVARPRPGASDATPELARRLLAERDPWPSATRIDTTGTTQASRAASLDAIEAYRARPFARYPTSGT